MLGKTYSKTAYLVLLVITIQQQYWKFAMRIWKVQNNLAKL